MQKRRSPLPPSVAALAVLYILLSTPAHATATFNCEAVCAGG